MNTHNERGPDTQEGSTRSKKGGAVRPIAPAHCCTAAVLWLALSSPVLAQATVPDFEGMWSDPPATPEEMLCFAFCTDWGIDYMISLLDDPANDERSYFDLWKDVQESELDGYSFWSELL